MIDQLGERETEDLKAPCSIHGRSIFFCTKRLLNFFVNVGPSLTQNMHNSQFYNIEINMQYLKRNNRSAFFNPITPKEIIDIVCNLKNHSSPGFDDIHISVVKRVIHIICSPLCKIFNLSLESGVFPNQMKIARVIPLYKDGLENNVCNYRPISVLTFFPKY